MWPRGRKLRYVLSGWQSREVLSYNKCSNKRARALASGAYSYGKPGTSEPKATRAPQNAMTLCAPILLGSQLTLVTSNVYRVVRMS